MIGRIISSAVAGLLFGLGLAVSGMIHSEKVLGFLDISGRWDPSLLFVLGGAVADTAVAFRFVLRAANPVFDRKFDLPTRKTIDPSLIAGSVLFGIGWGISGYCPGPAIALLASPSWESWAFVPALFAGFALHRFTRPAAAGSRDQAVLGNAERTPA